MKELFQLLAKYNATANAQMMGVLEKLTPEQMTKDVKAFYGSIIGLLNHILVSDVFGIKRFFKQYPELEKTRAKLPTFRMEGWKDIIWPSLAILKPIRTAVDEAIQQACDLLPEKEYAAILHYKNWDGKEMQKPVWLVWLHMFNHQTHNRGQIALILDQMGIENDYSGMLEKF
jgi:uncharacterized damage-inducible protein DinB